MTTPNEREILRDLGGKLAEAAAGQDRAAKAELWRRNNDRDPVRPMVWITEIPWHELAAKDDFLHGRCEDPFLREVEVGLRQQLFQWQHFPADMILDDCVFYPQAWYSSEIGLNVNEDTLQQHEQGGIVSHHYKAQISEPEDIEKIRMPEVRRLDEETGRRRATLEEIFEGIIPVHMRGIRHIWFTPWDRLYTLVDMTEMMYEMIERPDFVSALVSRYVDALTHELDQFEALGLLHCDPTNIRVGSGGYAYSQDLPVDAAENRQAKCSDLWGCGNAQIFAEISPEMHWEFSLQHEMRWLERWGITYYGCCEQLHEKAEILKRIPNLRKVSCSPRCDIPKAREYGMDDYVLSVKPNPAVVATDGWTPEAARNQIRQILRDTAGTASEIILKDISTIRDDPQRLDDWNRVVMDEVEKVAG